MWHVSSRSGVATLRTAIHLLLTYLLTSLVIGGLRCVQTMIGCRPELRPFIEDCVDLYFNVYYWFRVVFIHLATGRFHIWHGSNKMTDMTWTSWEQSHGYQTRMTDGWSRCTNLVILTYTLRHVFQFLFALLSISSIRYSIHRHYMPVFFVWHCFH